VKFRTFVSLLRSGQLALLLSITRLARPCYRAAFLASGLSSGLLRSLGTIPLSLDALAVRCKVDVGMRDGLKAWLEFGAALGELRSGPQGYSLRSKLARQLVDPANDAAAALIEETATLDNNFIIRAPRLLREPGRFTLNDGDARLVARSSRVSEPFICEMVDAVVPLRGHVKLFEIGCGAAAYIRHAAMRNPELIALGLELQGEAAALAAENIAKWNLTERVRIEVGDVMARSPEPVFDMATLHQNIYYFPVHDRVRVLEHVRLFLKPEGRLLLTTWCQGHGLGTGLLNLWATMSDGGGPLPTCAEMTAQLEQAGFCGIQQRKLIPGESFYAFIGVAPKDPLRR